MSRKKLVLALENADLEDQELVTEQELLEDENDIDKRQDEIDSDFDVLDETEESIGELAEHRDNAESSLETGGLTQQEAVLSEVAVETICNRLGIDYNKYRSVSIEDFKEVSSRIAATETFVSTTTDFIKKAIEAIIKALEFIYEKISDFVIALFKNTGKVRTWINQLRTENKELELDTANVKIIENSSLASFFSINATADYDSAIKVAGYAKESMIVGRNLHKVIMEIKDGITGTVSLIAKGVSFRETAEDLRQMKDSIRKSFSSIQHLPFFLKMPVAIILNNYFKTKSFQFMGIHLLNRTIESTIKTLTPEERAKTLATLDKKQADTVLDAAFELTIFIDRYKSDADSTVNAMKAVSHLVKSKLSANQLATREGVKDMEKNLNLLQTMQKDFSNLCKFITIDTTSMGFKTSRNLCKYVSLSIEANKPVKAKGEIYDGEVTGELVN